MVASLFAASALSLTVAQYVVLVPSVLLLAPLALELSAPGLAASLPLLNLLLLVLQNGMALFLPAWMPLGAERTGGIDQLGITVLTTVGTLALAIPTPLLGLLVAGGAGFVLRSVVGVGPALAGGLIVLWAVLAARGRPPAPAPR